MRVESSAPQRWPAKPGGEFGERRRGKRLKLISNNSPLRCAATPEKRLYPICPMGFCSDPWSFSAVGHLAFTCLATDATYHLWSLPPNELQVTACAAPAGRDSRRGG